MLVRLSVVAVVAGLVFAACNSGGSARVLVRFEAEVAGQRCPAGGVSVQTGLDANGNQVLDDAEVNADQTRFVCNGTSGPAGGMGPAGEQGDAGLNALSVVTAEAAGSNCQYGGARVDVGLDTDADGTLGSSEITSTRYICDRASVDSIYFGDVTIRTQADVARLAGIKVISGTLTLETIPGGVLTLPDLEIVSHSIEFFSQDGGSGDLDEVTAVNFPKLRRAGDISANFNSSLASITAPQLERLNYLGLSNNSALTTLSFPALAVIDELYMNNNAALVALNLPSLRNSYSFQINSHPALSTLTAPLLTQVINSLQVSDNAALNTCAGWRLLAGLSTRPRSVYVSNNLESSVCTAAEVCRATTVPGISSPLYQCERELPFTEALATCATLGTGASLAWVTSDAEWVALTAASASGLIFSGGWLGYTDAAVEGTWVATSGFTAYSPFARTDFWSTSQPSDISNTENALELRFDGRVNDSTGTQPLPFFCRVP
jgi:hypothetical protein